MILYLLIITPYEQPADNLYYAIYIALFLLMMIPLHVNSFWEAVTRKKTFNTRRGFK